MEEKVFFEYEGVRVTNTRFVVDGQTFAMNNVTSVKPFEKRPSRVGPVILIVLGVLSALGGGYLGVAARSCQTLGVAISISPNMDPHQNMPCPNCGVQILPKAAFCHACGRQLSARESDAPANKAVPEEERQEIAPRSQPSPQPAFRGLRILNWIIVALLVPGAALMLLRSSQPTGVVLVASLMAFLVGTFLLTAVLLSREPAYFLGFPVEVYRNPLRKLALVCNIVMALFGVIGLIACIATQQFGPMLAMLVYAIPPVLNVKGLRTIARYEV